MVEEVVNERGHFLDEKQKQVKQKIMEELMEALFGNLERNMELFNLQSVMDMVGSILIMFNREVLVHFFTTCELTHVRKDVMKHLFETIRDEVNNKIKKGMM